MSQPPKPPKPPKLVPGEPLWGTSEVSNTMPPAGDPAAANRGARSNPRGAASVPAGASPASAPPQPPTHLPASGRPGGAPMGATSTPHPYGQAATYGHGRHTGGYPTVDPSPYGRKFSTSVLAATAAICLVFGVVLGFAVAVFFV